MTRSFTIGCMQVLVIGCWWHESEGAYEILPVSCIDVGWNQARLTVEEVLDWEDEANEACVPLHVGDTVLVTAAKPCSIGPLTGQPTPTFIAPFAPYCGLEDEPAFICREEEVDGGPYIGNIIKVELRGDTLAVEWNTAASESRPSVACNQTFRVSFETVVPAASR